VSGGAFLGPNAITEVDVSSAWTRIIAPFPLNATLPISSITMQPVTAGSRRISAKTVAKARLPAGPAVQERARSRVAEIAELWAAGYL
jgi:hypothetical protein